MEYKNILFNYTAICNDQNCLKLYPELCPELCTTHCHCSCHKYYDTREKTYIYRQICSIPECDRYENGVISDGLPFCSHKCLEKLPKIKCQFCNMCADFMINDKNYCFGCREEYALHKKCKQNS